MRKSGIWLMALIIGVTSLTACGRKAAHDGMTHDGMAHESMEAEGSGMEENGKSTHGAHSGMHMSEENEVPSTTAEWQWKREPLEPGEEETLSIRISDADGRPVDKFKLNHEKLMHLIVVSKDLSSFQHLHPQEKGSSAFDVAVTFPSAGSYKLFADYIPEGGASETQSVWADVAGTPIASQPIVPDESLEKTEAGVNVQLKLEKTLVAGEETRLVFHMTDAGTGAAVTDLQPVLGAVGHVVILSADAERYLHVHPVQEDAKGPDAEFITTFPASGIYKIWGQFKRGGTDFIVPFVVKVS